MIRGLGYKRLVSDLELELVRVEACRMADKVGYAVVHVKCILSALTGRFFPATCMLSFGTEALYMRARLYFASAYENSGGSRQDIVFALRNDCCDL